MDEKIPSNKSLWNAIYAARVSKGYSQSFMAEKLGISQAAWQKKERGLVKTTSEEELSKIASLLGTTVDNLLGVDSYVLDHLPTELKQFIANPAAKEYLLKAYTEYLQSKMK